MKKRQAGVSQWGTLPLGTSGALLYGALLYGALLHGALLYGALPYGALRGTLVGHSGPTRVVTCAMRPPAS
jgi:hypothetical protein